MNGAMHLLPLHAYMACIRTTSLYNEYFIFIVSRQGSHSYTIKYIHSSNTSTTFYRVSTGYMFRPSWAIIRPNIWTGSFDFSAFWDPKLLQRCY